MVGIMFSSNLDFEKLHFVELPFWGIFRVGMITTIYLRKTGSEIKAHRKMPTEKAHKKKITHK